MTRPFSGAVAFACLLAAPLLAQAPSSAPQLAAVTHAAYSKNTELFAEWQPLIVGQTTRLTAHLTHTGDRFKPYADGKVTLTLSIETDTAHASADAPERPGVFRLNVTPTRAGNGRLVINVTATSGAEHFVINNVPVYPTAQAAPAMQRTVETGLISYAKERSWEEDFATAPVGGVFQGAARTFMIPSTAIVRDGPMTHVYVQRTPERFEWRDVRTRRIVGDNIEITSGLRDGERIVVRGADKMPRPQ